MTRARDLLVLTANVRHSAFAKRWLTPSPITTESLATAHRFSDWLALWFAQHAAGVDPAAARGQNPFLRWILHDDSGLLTPPQPTTPDSSTPEPDIDADPETWRRIHSRLTWRYPYPAATRLPAKTSVTTLRRRATELSEAAPFGPAITTVPQGPAPRPRLANQRAASEIGRAHHAFLERLSLDAVGSREQLEAQAQTLARDSVLTDEQVRLLDYHGLAALWDSDLGRRIRALSGSVQRELEFTARFTPAELAQFTAEPLNPQFEEEFVIVQGVVDLAVMAPSGIWLVDFKTDAVNPNDLAPKLREYEPQLRLYAHALQRIYRQPVTETWLYFLSARQAVRVRMTNDE
jgi:ATP-dependent exoDNAse (exonuclease V) beta subunit